jgi:myo-inositol catabolism protein IolC
MKMKLSIQVEKASNRAKWKWYKFYFVRGYGAPGRLEFVCPYSGMIAKTIEQEEAASVRRYWSSCARKSQEILDWLESIDPHRYTTELNAYLLRTIVTVYSIREIEKYQQQNPFEQPRPWQEV